MKVRELIEKLNGVDGELDVTVQLAPSGHISGCATVPVKDGFHGFDWESRQFVLDVEKDVDLWKDKCRNCSILDDGRVTSKLVCKDIRMMEYELRIIVDGKVRLKIPYSEGHFKRNKR